MGKGCGGGGGGGFIGGLMGWELVGSGGYLVWSKWREAFWGEREIYKGVGFFLSKLFCLFLVYYVFCSKPFGAKFRLMHHSCNDDIVRVLNRAV